MSVSFGPSIVSTLSSQIDVSIEMAPESKNGGKQLTEDEDNEYRQIQGM